MLQKLLRFLFILGLTLFSLRAVLASPNIMGHNWDFTFPYYLSNLKNLSLPSLYTWNQFNFGYPQQLTLVHLIPNLGYTLLVVLFGLVGAPKVLLISTIVFSFYGFQKLQSSFLVSKNTFIVASLLYCFSPFLFGEIVGGSWYMWISYAAIPWYLSFYKEYLYKKNSNLIPLLISSIFLISSMQNFIIVESFLLVYTLITFYYDKKTIVLKKYLSFHLILIVANSYWLSVLIQELSQFSKSISLVSFTNGFAQTMGSSQSIINIFNLSGYLDRNFYLLSLPGKTEPVFTALMLLSWAIPLFYLLSKNKISNKNRSMLLLFLLSLVLVKGGNAPFPGLTLFLHEKIRILTLYRSPQHLMLIPAIIFPVLIATFFNCYRHLFETKKMQTLLIILFAFVSVGWWYKGDFGSYLLSQKGQNFIDYYSLPKSVLTSFEISEKASLVHRNMFLPISQSPLFLKTQYQNNSQGGVSEYMYLTNPTFSAENNTKAGKIESSLCKRELLWKNHLYNTNTLFITARYDQTSIFTPCAKDWDNQSIVSHLEQTDNLDKLLENEHLTLYQINKNDFLPIISLKNSTGSGSIEYKKIDPTRYLVNIRNLNSDNKLLFLENFNPHWAIQAAKVPLKQVSSSTIKNITSEVFKASEEEIKDFIKTKKITDGKTDSYISKNLQNSIQNNNLQPTNTINWLLSKTINWQHTSEDYANLWDIDINNCHNKSIACISNPDGTYDISLEINYLPQKTYFVFLSFSASLLVILLFVYLIKKAHSHDQ